MLGYISNFFLFSPTTRNLKGFFSNIYCENLIKPLEVNLTDCGGPPVTGCPWSLWLRVIHVDGAKVFNSCHLWSTTWSQRSPWKDASSNIKTEQHNNSKPKFNKYSHNMTIKEDYSRWGIWKPIEKREVHWWGVDVGFQSTKEKV